MRLRIASAIALGAAAVLLAACATKDVQASPRTRADKKKLLVVTFTQGWETDGPKTFRHSSIPTAEKTLAEIGDKSGLYSVDYCRTGADVKK